MPLDGSSAGLLFARNPFHPPEGWRADFCSVERLHQVVHCRARRPAFQDATSGGIDIHKEEHSLVGEFGSEFPSDKYYCEEFNLTYQGLSKVRRDSGGPGLARPRIGPKFHG